MAKAALCKMHTADFKMHACFTNQNLTESVYFACLLAISAASPYIHTYTHMRAYIHVSNTIYANVLLSFFRFGLIFNDTIPH